MFRWLENSLMNFSWFDIFLLQFWNSLYDRIQECSHFKGHCLVVLQLKAAWNCKLLERIGGNWESWDYVHCPQRNFSLILFLSFFISFLNISFFVEDLFRFTVANEQDQGDKDENQGAPGSTKAETKLPDSSMTCTKAEDGGIDSSTIELQTLLWPAHQPYGDSGEGQAGST